MQQYREGQRLQGSDGKVYVVRNGMPVSENAAVGPAIGNDPRIPLSVQGQGLQNTRTAQEIANNPLTVANAQTNIAQGQNSIRQSQIGNVQELRKEYNALPEVKNYSEYLAQMSKALRAPNSAQGDLSVIYAFAKAMDPGSVVREGEMDMANSTSSLVQDMYRRFGQITEGNRLPANVRSGLVESIRSAGHGFKDAYDQQYIRYRDQAQALGADPKQVVGDHRGDAFRALEQNYIDKAKREQTQAYGDAGVETEIDENGNPIPVLRGGSVGDPRQEALKKRIEGTDRFGSGLAGMIDATTLGLSDEASAGLNAIGGALSGDGSFGSLYRNNLADERAYQDALRKRDPVPHFLGELTGGIFGMKGLNSALQAGRLAPLATRAGGIGSDMLYGAGYGAGSSDNNRLLGAGIGAAAAGGGNLVGQKILAPAIRGAMSPFGAGSPALPAAEQMIAGQAIKANPGTVMGKLNEASDLGMPLTLADADPRLRALGGTVVRKSPDAFALANENIGRRTLGQVDRLTGIVEQDMGPRLNLPTFKAGVKKSAQGKSRPLYESAKNQAPVDDAQINQMLQTPAGQRAARSGYDEALNNGEPVGDFAEQVDSITGQVRLVGRPSWHVLQRMKFALDDMPDQEGLARRFNSRLGSLNSDFKKANLTYAKEMRRGDIAEAGYGAASPNVRAPELGASMAAPRNMKDPALFRQGYGSNLIDKARGMRDAANPYEVAAMASPDQLLKMQAISPGLRGKFDQARSIENEMSLTNRELFGGSPTQPRAEADKLFDAGGLASDALELGLAVGAGAPPINAMRTSLFGGRFGVRALQDAYQMGVGKSAKHKADAIAPMLFNPNPQDVSAQLAAMIRQQALRDAYVQRTGMFGSSVGAPTGIVLTGR